MLVSALQYHESSKYIHIFPSLLRLPPTLLSTSIFHNIKVVLGKQQKMLDA